MWQGFVGTRIAASNRALRKLGIGLLLAALAVGLFFAKTLVNVSRGPAQVDDKELAAVTDATFLLRDFVTVQGRNATNTGIESFEQTTQSGRVISEQVTGRFLVMAVGRHLLVVKTKAAEIADSYTGAVVPLSGDVKSKIFSEITDGDLRAATLSVMLDATGVYAEPLIPAYLVVSVLILAGLWVLALAKRRADNPERHPFCKTLAAYGPLYAVVPQIDGELSAANSKVCGVTFTQNWILKGYSLMRRDELIWVYKKVTKHSVNLIPTGTSHAIILLDGRGKSLEVNGPEKDVNACLMDLGNFVPWAIFGYSKELEGTYRQQRHAFVQAVHERRIAMQSQK